MVVAHTTLLEISRRGSNMVTSRQIVRKFTKYGYHIESAIMLHVFGLFLLCGLSVLACWKVHRSLFFAVPKDTMSSCPWDTHSPRSLTIGDDHYVLCVMFFLLLLPLSHMVSWVRLFLVLDCFSRFVWFDSLRPSQHSLSNVGTGLPELNQYYKCKRG